MTTPQAQAVTVSLNDLKNGGISSHLHRPMNSAFGPDSLGILVVKDVPAEFAHLRHQTLSYASYLGNLGADELKKLENVKAKYLTGWSLGKEQLKNGQADMFKGSYYANCAFYNDASLDCARPTAEFNTDNFPEYLSPNVWPDETALPGFKPSVEALCRLIIDTAVLVARACDRFAAEEIPNYPPGYLEHVVSTSSTTKARLLHYFPQTEADEAASGADADDDDCDGRVARNTLAVFTQPNLGEEVDIKQHLTFGEFARGVVAKNTV
ncbi:hypothetical protein VdG1_03186 [Verticillium dahliae VDG1]|nr:hypothetical protein VdG1_03186 [Verticillium dahliae VDG1]